MGRTPGLYPGYGARLAHSVGSSPAGGTSLLIVKDRYMKKLFCAAALLMFSVPTLAASERMCAEISIRFTVFGMLARMTDSQEEYNSILYKKLLEGNASKESQQVLKSLIDLGWTSKKADVGTVALDLYDRCVGGTST